MKKQLFTEIEQVCFVVEDIRESIKLFADKYGIGPWVIMNFGNDPDDPEFNKNTVDVEDIVVEGEKKDHYKVYLACCDAVKPQLELIQPLDDNSTFSLFLKRRGPGVHHICINNPLPFGEMMDMMHDAGAFDSQVCKIDHCETAAFVDHIAQLGTCFEVHDRGTDFTPPSVKFEFYPPQEEK